MVTPQKYHVSWLFGLFQQINRKWRIWRESSVARSPYWVISATAVRVLHG